MALRFAILGALAALSACSPPPTARAGREAVAGEYATVESPQENARVAAPLVVTGVAPNAWYFEAQFDALLLGEDGVVLAQAPARAQSDWTVEGPVPFTVTFPFSVDADTPATIILQEDSTGEDTPEPLEVRVPVVLVPAG